MERVDARCTQELGVRRGDGPLARMSGARGDTTVAIRHCGARDIESRIYVGTKNLERDNGRCTHQREQESILDHARTGLILKKFQWAPKQQGEISVERRTLALAFEWRQSTHHPPEVRTQNDHSVFTKPRYPEIIGINDVFIEGFQLIFLF